MFGKPPARATVLGSVLACAAALLVVAPAWTVAMSADPAWAAASLIGKD